MIVSSTVVEDRAQVDARRMVCEQHTTDDGRVLSVFYLAEARADIAAQMHARVPTLNQQLADQEMNANIAEVLA